MLGNNAAIHYDTWQQAAAADLNTVEQALQTNLLGAWRTTQALMPLLRRSSHPRIVNVSSEGGSIAGMTTGSTPAYSVSKAALNAVRRASGTALMHTSIPTVHDDGALLARSWAKSTWST